MRTEVHRVVRRKRTGGPGSSLGRVSDDGVRGDLSSEVPGLRGEAGEGAAVAQQGTVLAAVGRGGGASLRELGGSAGGTPVPAGGEHGRGHRPPLSRAVGSRETETGVATDGSGRDLPGEEAEVSHGGEQSGD